MGLKDDFKKIYHDLSIKAQITEVEFKLNKTVEEIQLIENDRDLKLNHDKSKRLEELKSLLVSYDEQLQILKQKL